MKGLIKKTSIWSFLLALFFTPFSYGQDLNNTQNDKNLAKKHLVKNKVKHLNAAKSSDASPQDSAEAPPKIGNFALPDSQQPGSLVGIGQGILDENQTQLFTFAQDYRGPGNYAASVAPYILHGVTDNFSLLLAVPIEANKIDEDHSSGLSDAFFQAEYAYYQNSTADYTGLATIIGSVSLPTGSSEKQPPTGVGAPSFLIGTTYSRMYVNWFGFTSPAVLMTTSNNGTKYGNDYLYQFGLGRNIFDIGTKWLFAGLVELDGDYDEKDIIHNVVNPNSGGNFVFVTPSLWISSRKLTIQLGVGYPVVQHLFGNQSKTSYLLTGNLGWTFG